MAASFAADGDDFLIQYDIQSQAATAFDVAVYRSQDGTTLDAQVASQRVTDSADLAVGLNHSLTLSFTATDVAEEYSLILVVDASSEVSESNESNNQLEFSGGVFQDAADVVHVHGSSGSDTITAAPAAGSTVDVTWDSTTYNYAAANFDQLHIRTQEGASTTTVNSSLTETVWFFGGSGADVFTSGGGDDLLYGGLGDDTLSGGAGNDYIVGDQRVATDDGGRDYLNGNAGDDLLTGDHDSNSLDTLAGGDWLDGGSGDDELYATHTGFYDASTAEADELAGGDDDDLLVGSADADLLEGGAGVDTIYAGYGDDTIYGGTDADTLYAEGGDDLVYGDDANADVADGDDYISAGEGVDEVHAGGGDDLVYGGDGPDTMYGDEGDDQLYGQGSSDQLYGGDGADELDGGASADFLYGGNGNDTLIDLSEADTIDGGLGLDSDEFVDDGSADFSTSGTWTADLGGALYGQQLQAPSGTGSSYARWAFDDLPSGAYMAYATWDVTVGAATNAPFKVLDEVGGTTLQAVSIDQTNAPIGNDFLGRNWVPLGGFDVTDGDLVVELSDLADGIVLADSVRLEPLTTGSNTLSISPVSPGLNDWASIRAMTIEQADAMPELSIEGESSAMEEVGGEIEFTLTRAGDLRSSLVVDLSVDDSTEASAPSQVTFLANESTAAFTLWAVTDAVQDGSQDVRVFANAEGYQGASSLVSVDETIETQFIVNDSAIAGSDLVGTWTPTTAGGSYSSGHLEDGNTGKGTKSATFRPDIDVPGNFDVYLWNTIVTNGSSDVPIDIVHQSGTTTIDVDQAGSAAGWMRLGTFEFAAGTTGAVTIRNDDSGGVVVADAVKWQRVSTATDQNAPVATLASPGDGEAVNVTSLNSTGYLDVTFADSGEGIDAASITDSGAEISISGLTITGTPTLVSGTTYRYAFTGSASTGAMQVDFAGGSFADQVGNVNVAASETIYVEPGTVGDIAATAFAVAAGKLKVTYDVIGVAATAFQVGVYSTVDGVTPGTLLQSQSVSTPSLLAIGTGHVVSFTATFAQQNFAHSLLALVNSTNVSREQTLWNNSALLDSGVFQASNGTVHVYGNGAYDSLSATEVGSDLRINLNTAETIFTASTVTALHVQVGAGGSDVDLSAADSVAAYVFTGSGVDDVELGDTSSFVDTGEGNDTIDGGAGSDVLVGGAGDDTISGGAGNDEITGGDGDDLLYGNADDDELYGNDGADTVYGGLGDDYIDGGDGGGTLVGDLAVGDSSSGGDDEIHGGNGVDVIVGDQYSGSGTGGDDLLYGYDSDDSLNGGSYDNLAVAGSDYFDAGSGDDVITTGSGVNTVFAGNGDDVVYGGDGADTVYAGAGNDVVNTAGGGGVVDGGAGDDELNGGSGADVLSGGSGDDVLKGGDGDDTLAGDAGNDSLFGQLGDDTLTGGAGDDWLFGSNGNDLLYGDEISGGAGNDYIFGDSGDDWIDGADGVNNLFGGSGEDEIHAGDDEDYILGGSGNDYINGGGGGGTLVGDSLLGQGGYGDDTIIGGSGADLIVGDYLKNDDTGIGGNDVIFAGDGDDEVYGDSKQGEDNAGVDNIDSGAGDDVVYGGGGNDEIVAGLGDDLVFGEAGNDRMEGGLGDDTLWGGSGNDQLYGDDAVQGYGGSGGDDFLNGGSGDDVLVGNLGGDILDGNAGRDQLDPGEEVGDGILALPTIDTIFAVAQGTMTVITGTVTSEFAGEATITLAGGVVATIHVTESGWFALAIPRDEFIPSTSIAAVLTDGEGTESVTKIFFYD